MCDESSRGAARLPDDTKKILAVHDLSSFGRCSLMVVVPALSAMGAQVVPLPTALLSSHTGGFSDMTFYDLTHTMSPALTHYRSIGLTFDAIYTGFLGSAEQIDTVRSSIDLFGKGALTLVDPVMGDDGEVYSTYTPEICRRMGELCRCADLLTPNLTEACFLCGVPYVETRGLTEEEALAFADSLTDRLHDLFGVKQLALTGTELAGGRIATVSADYSGSVPVRRLHVQKRIAAGYPGTGDLFASILLGRMLAGFDFHSAVENACELTAAFILDTARYDTPRREGLRLEQNLYRLIPDAPHSV